MNKTVGNFEILVTDSHIKSKPNWRRVVITHLPTGERKTDAAMPIKSDAEYLDLFKSVLRMSVEESGSEPAFVQKKFPKLVAKNAQIAADAREALASLS